MNHTSEEFEEIIKTCKDIFIISFRFFINSLFIFNLLSSFIPLSILIQSITSSFKGDLSIINISLS